MSFKYLQKMFKSADTDNSFSKMFADTDMPLALCILTKKIHAIN